MTKETNNHPVTLEQVEEAMNHESTENLSMDISRKSNNANTSYFFFFLFLFRMYFINYLRFINLVSGR